MTGYLQRLFDRTGGLPTAGVLGQPAMRPGSPLAQIDQRLGARELASDFTFGVGPDAAPDPDPDLLEERAEPTLLPRHLQQPLPPLPARPASPPMPENFAPPGDVLPPRPLEPDLREAAPKPVPSSDQTARTGPEPTARPAPLVPLAKGMRPTAPATTAPEPLAVPPPRIAAVPASAAAEQAAAARAAPGIPPHAEARLRSVPAPAPRAAEPARLSRGVSQPLAAPADTDRPLPAAQPVRSGIEPPALPLPEPIDWREVDRRIAAALERKERSPAAQPQPQPQPPAPVAAPTSTEQASPQQSAPNFKTAAETSIIGPIEQTSRPRTLFGERLR